MTGRRSTRIPTICLSTIVRVLQTERDRRVWAMFTRDFRELPTALPGGAPLAAGETPLVGDAFRLSVLAFYLRTQLVLTNRRLYAIRPNTLLGLIPVGTSRSNFPIENIAGVVAATRFDVGGVFFGLLGIVVGLGAMAIAGSGLLNLLGLVLVLIGLGAVIGSPKQAIEVMNSGGGVIRFPVSVLDRSRTVEFANRVSQAVAHSSGRHDAPTDATNTSGEADATEGLRQLNRLREAGLITEVEYGAKRAEILRRL